MNICSGNIAEIMRKLYIIYVNSQIKDETALEKLMHDFVFTIKEDEKGVAGECVKRWKI